MELWWHLLLCWFFSLCAKMIQAIIIGIIIWHFINYEYHRSTHDYPFNIKKIEICTKYHIVKYKKLRISRQTRKNYKLSVQMPCELLKNWSLSVCWHEISVMLVTLSIVQESLRRHFRGFCVQHIFRKKRT